MEHSPMISADLYTIGYGNRSVPDFFALLAKYQIEYLIDVRSQPYSKIHTAFTQKNLKHHCQEYQYKYVYMGDTIGGIPSGTQYLEDDGNINYARLSESATFQTGIGRLVTALTQRLPIVVMCCELRPQECHRSKLISHYLVQQQDKLGIALAIKHIDEKGNLISQQQVENYWLTAHLNQEVLPGMGI